MSKLARAATHFAVRRIAGRSLRRFALLRFLPEGMLAMLVAEGLMLAWRELRKRPDLRRKLWQVVADRRKSIFTNGA
jgi:hypothetical protein